MKTNWESTSEDIRIEILPLIDVIFCILTFFILASVVLTRQSGINVDLPSASTGTAQMREMIVVSVDPVGQLYLEQTPISREQLAEALRTYRQGNPNGLMVLYASRSARYDDVVNVLDLLRSVGGRNVALATLPDSGEADNSDLPEFDFDFGDPNDLDSFEFPGSTDPFGSDGSLDPGIPDSDPGALPELVPPEDAPAGAN